jgi:hypothetical protein
MTSTEVADRYSNIYTPSYVEAYTLMTVGMKDTITKVRRDASFSGDCQDKSNIYA